MNTTVKSLQDVYVALGGELTDTYEDIAGGVPVSDYTTIPDVIEAISQLAGKTLELPKTTSADTGKLLVVNEDGDWDKGDALEELPAVTESDNGKLLEVVNGAWGKTPFKLKVLDINGSTNSSGIIYDNLELVNYKKDIGHGTNVLILGAKITNELDIFDANITTVWCDVTYDKSIGGNDVTSWATSGVSIRCKALNGGSEVALANKSVKVRVTYLEFKTE